MTLALPFKGMCSTKPHQENVGLSKGDCLAGTQLTSTDRGFPKFLSGEPGESNSQLVVLMAGRPVSCSNGIIFTKLIS